MPLATIKEIAAEAGVSIMTVSNVINHVRGKVSAETEKRVREIMEKHHYVPNMAARSLISKSSHTIALLLPMWPDSPSTLLLNPYAGYVLGYFAELLRAKHYYVMLAPFYDASEALKMVRTWQADGAIQMFPHNDDITHELVEKCETPLVVMDRYFDDLDMLSVCIDDRKGGYLATRHLLEEGHRKIGFAGPAVFASTVIYARYQGFLDALAEYQLEVNPAWIFDGIYRSEGGMQVADAVLQMESRPTAVVTSEDLIACGIMKRLQEQGYCVPEDLSVVGFDNSEPSKIVTPMLTTVNQFIRRKAECAVEMLLHAMEDSTYRREKKMIDVDLVKRQTVLHIG